jgi:hypothetical protein
VAAALRPLNNKKPSLELEGPALQSAGLFVATARGARLARKASVFFENVKCIPGRLGVFASAMPSASEYRSNAKEMMRKALAAFTEDERQEYLRMAAAWATLAQSADDYDRRNTGPIPFDEPPPNPLADESDV